MNKQNTLQMQAVKAAKNQDWQAAVDFNKQLLSLNERDIGALNRLGAAYLQLKEAKKAKKAFESVLEFDKSNKIARKQLANIKDKKVKKPSFSKEHFIEEPGTTKIVELHRIADKKTLEKLDAGQQCSLQPKNRFISVETEDGNYIGALPEDLSFRLTQLIKRGNKYSAMVHTADAKECVVYIREIYRSAKNENINSFPTNKTAITAINDIDERFLLEDNIPVDVVSTDEDTQKTLDDIETPEDD